MILTVFSNVSPGGTLLIYLPVSYTGFFMTVSSLFGPSCYNSQQFPHILALAPSQTQVLVFWTTVSSYFLPGS